MEYNNKPVVVIDDDIDDLELAKEAITKSSSVECLLFDSAEAFYNFLHKADPGVYPCMIFLDLNMPRISGFDTLHYIKSNPGYKDIPVIILSTSSHDKERIKSYQLGADGFVTKPCSYDQVKNLFQKYIKHFCHNKSALQD